MAALSWLVAPALAAQLGGPTAWPRALVACLTVGLVWQGVLVLVLVRRETGTLRWRAVADALWLHRPRSPRTGRVGGRVWWVLLPAVLVVGLEQLLPSLHVPAGRDLGAFLRSTDGHEFLSGNWPWFAAIVVMAVFNTVLGEELLFRGLLLPRMRGVFGRADWLANGLLFAPTTCTCRGRSRRRCSTPWRWPTRPVATRAPGSGSSCTASSRSSSSAHHWPSCCGDAAQEPASETATSAVLDVVDDRLHADLAVGEDEGVDAVLDLEALAGGRPLEVEDVVGEGGGEAPVGVRDVAEQLG